MRGLSKVNNCTTCRKTTGFTSVRKIRQTDSQLKQLGLAVCLYHYLERSETAVFPANRATSSDGFCFSRVECAENVKNALLPQR